MTRGVYEERPSQHHAIQWEGTEASAKEVIAFAKMLETGISGELRGWLENGSMTWELDIIHRGEKFMLKPGRWLLVSKLTGRLRTMHDDEFQDLYRRVGGLMPISNRRKKRPPKGASKKRVKELKEMIDILTAAEKGLTSQTVNHEPTPGFEAPQMALSEFEEEK